MVIQGFELLGVCAMEFLFVNFNWVFVVLRGGCRFCDFRNRGKLLRVFGHNW